MGIYDRDYYRQDGPSFLGSFVERGTACKYIIAINVVFFILQLVTLERGRARDGIDLTETSFFTSALWLDPELVMHGQVWRLLTYAFLHDPWYPLPLHLVFNMLFLWWFGKEMEDHYGTREFTAFYLLAAVLGGMAFTLARLAGLAEGGFCVGASGAVTAVLVLLAIHYPSRVILVWFFPMPIWLFVVFNVGQDLFIFVSQVRTPVAVTVHLAGAALALLYYKGQWRIMNLFARFRGWQRQLTRPKLRVYREELQKPALPPASFESELDPDFEAQMDAVLAKVARLGRESLTETENQVLLRASEHYKRRRR